jgi:hypothetical protein
MTSFYREMRNLKLHGAPPMQRIRFSQEELRSHFARIGSLVNEVDAAAWEHTSPVVEVAHDLDRCPEKEEILSNLDGMRESSPGPDGVTVLMLRHAGPAVQRKLVELIQRMWNASPEEWEPMIHEAEVVALFKKGDRNKLDNYRGICLLQVVSRLVARIAGRRLSQHLEESHILATEQWGFRPYRSAIDALFVMGRLLGDASAVVSPDPLVLDMMDIQKAYPNCSRNAMEQSLILAGVPPRMRDILGKLDSLTLYRCRSPVGLSAPYQTLRGTREGCPAAPVKFNVLHHFATMAVREAWEKEGIHEDVAVTWGTAEQIWPEGTWPTKQTVHKTLTAQARAVGALPTVGYADDTTLIGRLSTVDRKRATATRVYGDWGHAVHPDKWQRLWSGPTVPPPSAQTDGFCHAAKVLGCFLEADGGYDRELAHRIAQANAICRALLKRVALTKMSDAMKGRLFRASVLASLLYGTETRCPPPGAVRRMQVFVNACERRLIYGPSGGTKDMTGKATQADIRARLGNRTVQLEIDMRTLRYVGHVARMPMDRWERRLLQGFLEEGEADTPCRSADRWWTHVRSLIKSVFGPGAHTDSWFAIAGDKLKWRQQIRSWGAAQVTAERQDTQKAREERWRSVAVRFGCTALVHRLWAKAKEPDPAGTSLEGASPEWLQKVVLAGGVHPDGWVEAAPAEWRTRCEDPSAQTWVQREGEKVRRRVLGKGWGEGVGMYPVTLAQVVVDPAAPLPPPQRRSRIRGKQTVQISEELPKAPPALPPPPLPPPLAPAAPPLAPPARRRLRGKQRGPGGEGVGADPAAAGPVDPARPPTAPSSMTQCDKCGLALRLSSVSQHNRLYCPFRESTTQPSTRRKVLRPAPPQAPKVAPPPAAAVAAAAKAQGPMPYIHVRWQAPLPQVPRADTSIPGEQAPRQPRAKRPTAAPPPPQPPPLMTGCYATCGRCNQCGACRRRECNGGCVGCSKCKTCKAWGDRLAAKDPAATAKHAEMVLLPPVEKRKAKDPGNLAKWAATRDRPAGAPAGSVKCPYCEAWLPAWHQEGCPSMPYDIWIAATRARQVAKFGQPIVDTWTVQCQHCATPFPSGASKRVHLSGCERRRTAADLPLNMFPATR